MPGLVNLQRMSNVIRPIVVGIGDGHELKRHGIGNGEMCVGGMQARANKAQSDGSSAWRWEAPGETGVPR